MKRIFGTVLSFMMVFMMVFQTGNLVFADDVTERTDINITNFEITKSDGTVPAEGFYKGDALKLEISWDASFYQDQLKTGDYFILNLPNEFIIPTNAGNLNFPITDGGNKVADAVVTPGPGNAGGTIKVTFTNYVEGKFNIKGTMFLNARFNSVVVTQYGDIPIAISIGSFTKEITIKVRPYGAVNPQEVLCKWDSGQLLPNGNVEWTVRINFRKDNFPNLVFKDALSSNSGDMTGIEYVPETFRLREVEMQADGSITKVNSEENVGNKVEFNESKTEFSYRFGDVNGKSYMFHYQSTYKEGLTLRNKAELISADQIVGQTAKDFSTFQGGGQGSGDLKSKIKIIKVDEETNAPLKGAKFSVERVSTGDKFDLVTNDSGEAVSNKLIPDKYRITEIDPPVGYHASAFSQEIDVQSTVDTSPVTVKNKPIKINISVKKIWEGGKEDSVVIRLFANNDEIDHIVLNEGNEWKHTFENLRKFKDGEVIEYTVKEDAVPDYTTEILGNVEEGFTFHNTKSQPQFNPEKIDISVIKQWIGRIGNMARIHLYADGIEIGSVVLDAGNDWRHVFYDLNKTDITNKRIDYTITEDPIDGYNMVIRGNTDSGFVVTNTEKGNDENDDGSRDRPKTNNDPPKNDPPNKENDPPKDKSDNTTDIDDPNVPLDDITAPPEDVLDIPNDQVPKGDMLVKAKAQNPILPKTGDSLDIGIYLALMFISSACLAFLISIRRKIDQ